jgi:hypothetical protein
MEFEQRKKEYNKNYFQQNSKYRYKICTECDNKQVKYNSWLNHLKCKKHINNCLNKNNIEEIHIIKNPIDEIKEDLIWLNNDIEDFKSRFEKISEKIKNI